MIALIPPAVRERLHFVEKYGLGWDEMFVLIFNFDRVDPLVIRCLQCCIIRCFEFVYLSDAFCTLAHEIMLLRLET